MWLYSTNPDQFGAPRPARCPISNPAAQAILL
jgi:hypothetical protein